MKQRCHTGLVIFPFVHNGRPSHVIEPFGMERNPKGRIGVGPSLCCLSGICFIWVPNCRVLKHSVAVYRMNFTGMTPSMTARVVKLVVHFLDHPLILLRRSLQRSTMDIDVVSGVALTKTLQCFETQCGKSCRSEDQCKETDANNACVSFACLLLSRWGNATAQLHV